MRAALLIIDTQIRFLNGDPKAKEAINQAIPIINKAIGVFREKRLPIFRIYQKDEGTGLIFGKSDYEFPKAIKIQKTDYAIHKTHENAFYGTTLLEILKKNNIERIILTGFCAEGCVLSTYKGAFDQDLQPIILRGSIASPNSENIRFVENICESITVGILKDVLE